MSINHTSTQSFKLETEKKVHTRKHNNNKLKNTCKQHWIISWHNQTKQNVQTNIQGSYLNSTHATTN